METIDGEPPDSETILQERYSVTCVARSADIAMQSPSAARRKPVEHKTTARPQQAHILVTLASCPRDMCPCVSQTSLLVTKN
jgi:hypothetical protein